MISLETAMSSFEGMSLSVRVILGFLTVLGLTFFLHFVPRALWLRWKLGLVLYRTRTLIKKPGVDLSQLFERDRLLARPWKGFRESLISERALNSRTGSEDTIALRATSPAEAFFAPDSLIPSATSSEVYKHFPGIFTGLGIIGTFLGLIAGLKGFAVSDDPATVRKSLDVLLHSVSDAFFVSMLAIALAMVATLVEKVLLSWLHKAFDKLNSALDSAYKAGISGEILSRIATASEESASQARILKDALVEDLKALLTEVTNKQISAIETGHVRLGDQITTSLGDGLRVPLDRIAIAVGHVSQDQSSAVQQLLTDVLSSFGQRLQDLFGGQLSGINQMQQQTIHSLQTAIERIGAMAGSLEGASQRAVESMAAQVGGALSALEASQSRMQGELQTFIGEVRLATSQSQSESSANLQAALISLAEHAKSSIGDLSSISRNHAGALGGQVDEITRAVSGAADHMAASVGKLASITSDAMVRMNGSADALSAAAGKFGDAGRAVAGSFEASRGLTNLLSQSATEIGTASRSLDAVLADYRTTRDGVSGMISSMNAVIESARREASLTADVLSRLDSSASRLAVAHQSVDEYLAKVSEVLTTAHQSFADNVARTLGRSNTEFYDTLTQATGLLRVGIEELALTLESASPLPSPEATER